MVTICPLHFFSQYTPPHLAAINHFHCFSLHCYADDAQLILSIPMEDHKPSVQISSCFTNVSAQMKEFYLQLNFLEQPSCHPNYLILFSWSHHFALYSFRKISTTYSIWACRITLCAGSRNIMRWLPELRTGRSHTCPNQYMSPHCAYLSNSSLHQIQNPDTCLQNRNKFPLQELWCNFTGLWLLVRVSIVGTEGQSPRTFPRVPASVCVLYAAPKQILRVT